MILEQMGHGKKDDAAFLSECDRELEEDYRQNLY